MKKTIFISMGCALLFAGCVQNSGNVASSGGNIAATRGSTGGAVCESPNPAHLRPECKNIPGSTRKYTLTKRFFIEKKKIMPIGKTVAVGQPLYYVTYHDANKFATTAGERVVNCDSSPLNANWVMEPGRQYQVWGLISPNNTDSYYLINNTAVSPSSWVSDLSGMLCSDGISFSNGEMRSGGMPHVYQSQPLRFETVETSSASPKSVSVVIKEMDGATVVLEMSASSGGRSFHKSVETFDLIGGRAELHGLTFEFEKAEGGVLLKTVKEPVSIEDWLTFTLDMPK